METRLFANGDKGFSDPDAVVAKAQRHVEAKRVRRLVESLFGSRRQRVTRKATPVDYGLVGKALADAALTWIREVQGRGGQGDRER